MSEFSDKPEKLIALNMVARYGALAINAVIMFMLIPHIVQATTLKYYGLQSLSAQGLHVVGLIGLAIGVSYDRYAVGHFAKQEFDEFPMPVSRCSTAARS